MYFSFCWNQIYWFVYEICLRTTNFNTILLAQAFSITLMINDGTILFVYMIWYSCSIFRFFTGMKEKMNEFIVRNLSVINQFWHCFSFYVKGMQSRTASKWFFLEIFFETSTKNLSFAKTITKEQLCHIPVFDINTRKYKLSAKRQ